MYFDNLTLFGIASVAVVVSVILRLMVCNDCRQTECG